MLSRARQHYRLESLIQCQQIQQRNYYKTLLQDPTVSVANVVWKNTEVGVRVGAVWPLGQLERLPRAAAELLTATSEGPHQTEF